jgi:hypothetical protein
MPACLDQIESSKYCNFTNNDKEKLSFVFCVVSLGDQRCISLLVIVLV